LFQSQYIDKNKQLSVNYYGTLSHFENPMANISQHWRTIMRHCRTSGQP